MDKETFSYLVSSPEDISIAEVRNLETLAQQYPYCQLTHSLIAKGYHIHFSESQYSNKIREAAAHALSRNALRKLINGTFVNQRTAAASVSTFRSVYAYKTPPQTAPREEEKPVTNVTTEAVVLPESVPVVLENEPIVQLENVLEVQAPAIVQEEVVAETIAAIQPVEEIAPVLVKENINPEASIENVVVEEEPHILEFTNEAETITTPSEVVAEVAPVIEEQHNIIDKFIQNDPGRIKMQKATEENEEIEDLAERSSAKPKSLNLVTESFAKIMAMQGRKDKAIEIYQKLILKFPEKSAYFASKIEELS